MNSLVVGAVGTPEVVGGVLGAIVIGPSVTCDGVAGEAVEAGAGDAGDGLTPDGADR